MLRAPTDPRWLEVALGDFDRVLMDHAHCEKKAAAQALSLVASYPDRARLVQRCARLAQEELGHFRQVYDRLLARGLTLGRDPGDPYAQALRKHLRRSDPGRLTDLLLVSALIEARSCERLGLLAGALPDPDLRQFYAALAQAEAGHEKLFVGLAREYDRPEVVAERLAALAEAEADVVASLPIEPRVH
ncbi:MAG: tRNA-(ms[2]io[6]A)-hydroxylase [Planctomycetes bacterium]|nr:tRNA-(ms[2]io[6]A)-hydroxylase [Planctomycetota bacterium]